MWRGHCWNRGVTHSHHGILEIFDSHIEFIIFLLYGHHEDHSDIRANRKVLSVIGYNQSLVFFFGKINGLVQSVKNISANSIHFTAEFYVQDAIAKIFNNDSAVLKYFFALPDVVKNDKCILPGHFFILLLRNIIVPGVAFFYLIETLVS